MLNSALDGGDRKVIVSWGKRIPHFNHTIKEEGIDM